MKTNKTHQPARKTQPTRPPRFALKPDETRPDPQCDNRHDRQNDFLALCFYPGMKAVELPLTSYPTAV